MAVIENSVIISRPPEEVFDALVDPRSELRWNPDVVSMEMLTDGPIAAGSRYRAKWKGSPVVTLVITEVDRPRSWAYFNDGPIAVNLSISLTPEAEGTLLRSRFEAHANGWFKLIFPLFLILLRRTEKKTVQYAKQYVESRAAASAVA